MILRFIYKIWKYFWRTIFALFVFAILLISIAIAILQLPQSKTFIKDEVVTAFNRQFDGNLQIDEIDGFIPFNANIHGGRVFSVSDSLTPVLSFEKASAKIDWWELLQQNLAITSFEVINPSVKIGMENDELTLFSAFNQTDERQKRQVRDDESPIVINRLNIFAPLISVENGTIIVDSTVELPEKLALSTPFNVENLNFNIFLELTDSQIFFELPNFFAEIPGSHYEVLQLSGQFYNDERYFELNRFRVGTALGHADFSFEATPVNLYKENFIEQFKNASYNLQLTESSFKTELIQQFIPGYPDFENDLEMELISEGTLTEYYIDRLQANIGESSVLISAQANDIFLPEISYNAQLDNVVIHPSKLDWISRTFLDGEINLDRYQLSTIRGKLNGDQTHLSTDFLAQTQAGSFLLDGNIGFGDTIEYDLIFEVDSLDVTPFIGDSLSPSIIQGRLTLDGTDIGDNASFLSSVDLSQSQIYGYDVDSFIAEFIYESRQMNYNIRGGDNELYISANGLFGREGDNKHFITEGEVQNFDIKKFVPEFHAEETNFNSTFSANVRWDSIEDIYGRVSFEMDESMIDQDTLRAHQFYADINEAANEHRTLRFTSSFFDGEMSGNLKPRLLQNFTAHWNNYLNERVAEELLFTLNDSLVQYDSHVFDEENPSAVLSIDMTVKDLSLLRKYLPELPNIESSARFNTSINATKERLLITGNLFDENFHYGDISAENFDAVFTASFRHDSKLKNSSTVDLQLSSTESAINNYQFKESFVNLTMRDDSIHVNQRLERLRDDLALETSFTGYLRDDRFEMLIDKFSLGTSSYLWIAEGQPQFTYTNKKALQIEDLILSSDTDYIEINGTYSSNIEDRVNYNIKNLRLSRVSNLIGGRIDFSGIMNGDFNTQTLTRIPSIQGEINVEEGRIMNRLIGDVSLNSQFNSETNRFDTEIHVYTDPEKYSRYYNRNDGIGQDLLLTGFFKLPDENTDPEEDLFYFDADLRQIDMWITTFIIPGIIVEMEGSSTGEGFIRGNANDFDFNANFQIRDVFGVPAFTNVGYTFNGDLDFNKRDGLLFRNIELRDNQNGRGVLSGQVDLDEFSPLTILNLTLDLEDLQFMNNPYNPDVPFYGSIFGTGQAQITGTAFDPVLRTTRPLILSPRSRISIPLEPEIQFEQDRRFIQFVDSFDIPFWETQLSRIERSNGNGEDDLTFLQLFTMDIQVQAINPVNVRLIFDRVTNDILSTNGTGQMRILLEDQDVSMFGRFNIESGDYQFVSGDIFTRRFTLQEGGAISWSGDLVDAGLNVTAVYRARPNISTLLGASGTGGNFDPGQRIPIELVLQIGGTITAVENEFFFRVPTGIESSVDPTIASQISNLNQNEDEKLIQATSILLSGNFIPQSQAQGLGLAEGFSGTAAVVNPLITSQVINPLLSNQINSLLRSDITFDVDFNFTAFNELDLGIALRLFDDRVILRREGQITGEQSDIGDLGATYRINRTFSVTAFHRQDPTLSYTSGIETRQAQEMNGVGLEAQVQFNTWNSLRGRISNAFRSILGIKKEEKSDEEPLANTKLNQLNIKSINESE